MNYNDIYPIVRRHIDKMDFYGLLADGAPSDEFEIETEMVAIVVVIVIQHRALALGENLSVEIQKEADLQILFKHLSPQPSL